jgi:hypothetical protein
MPHPIGQRQMRKMVKRWSVYRFIPPLKKGPDWGPFLMAEEKGFEPLKGLHL